MLEAKYYKDYRHNYMILRCERKESMNSYQHKILTSDKIGELLKCSVRHINGITYYYYDISSRTTLEGLYRGRKMSYDQVKDVLYQLCGICEKLAGYFMEEDKLVLLPEHIYYDFTSNKYIGLYYPDYRTEEADIYRPLMDFLIEHIDTEDVQLTEDMYRLYEMSEEKHFCIDDALKILECKDENTCGRVNEEIKGPELTPQWEPISEQITENSTIYGEMNQMPVEKQQREAAGKKSIFYPAFMILSVIGIAGAVAVCNIYELTQEEQLTLYGSVAAMGVCLLICLSGMISGRKKTVASTTKLGLHQEFDRGFREETKRKANEGHFDDEAILSLEHVISRDMNLEMAENKPPVYETKKCNNAVSCSAISNFAQEDESYGNTVFFDESKVEERKLYAIDQKNKKHIELKKFPCTIGKMAGCVDYVLPDNSVSRIHARFDKQGEKILLTDMNSTNGTYKNGLRMQPQETVAIEPGDEIRFGSLNYCYR